MMTITKPLLKQTQDRSTAVTDLKYTGTFNRSNYNRSHPTFQMPPHSNKPIDMPIKYGIPNNYKPQNLPKKEPVNCQPISRQPRWTETTDVQTIIDLNIETDIEQSNDSNLHREKYFFTSERVCAEKTLPIPQEIKILLTQNSQLPRNQIPWVFYGYWPHADALYYVIGYDLYVYKVSELKKLEEVGRNVLMPEKRQSIQPVRLRKDKICRKIHEVIFSDNQNGLCFLQMPSKYALIIEYDYFLEIVNYKFESSFSTENQAARMSQFSIINLNISMSIESKIADFITITPANTLLYLDQKLNLVHLTLSSKDGKIKKRQTREDRFISFKQKFTSRNYSNIKYYASRFITNPISFLPSLKKNLGLVYDEKRSMVFTWTSEGDREDIMQKLKREIKVYEFTPTKSGVIQGLMKTTEEQILSELNYPINPPKVTISKILKADSDYHKQASLIILMSNGDINYLIKGEKTELKFKLHSPSFDSLKEKVELKRRNLELLSNMQAGKDANMTILNTWGQKYSVQKTTGNQQQVLGYFNDRALSVGLIRTQKKLGMFLTVCQNNEQNNPQEVFEVGFNNQFFSKRIDTIPSMNQIFETKCNSLHPSDSLKVLALQQFETLRQLRNGCHGKYIKLKTQGCHETLRQVHHGPRYFTYLTNRFLATFAFVRPVDVVYYLLTSQKESFCKNYLKSIIGLRQSEICCMLLQIYCASEGTTYYIPKKYKRQVQDTINGLIINSQKTQFSQSQVNNENRINSWNMNGNRDRNYRPNESEDDDELIKLQTGDTMNNELKIKIRNLFQCFSDLQKKASQSEFDNIKLKNYKSSVGFSLEQSFKNLSHSQKSQAKNCLLYISRVLYPFWNAKCLTTKKGQQYLQTVYKKVNQLGKVVELLRLLTNNYWERLQDYLLKLDDIIQIFLYIPNLPEGLTLSEAMSKDQRYFETFIFESFRQNYDPNHIGKLKMKFPFYITKQFEKLISVYKAIENKRDKEEIMRILNQMEFYPSYFINYLKKEKPYLDVSEFASKEDKRQMRVAVVEKPHLTFVQQMEDYFQNIVSQDKKMIHKFEYLELIKRKLDEQKKGHAGRQRREIADSRCVEKYSQKYEQYFKRMKLQQKCLQELQEKGEEFVMRRKEIEESGHISGIISQFFAKIINLFGSNEEEVQRSESISSFSSERRKEVYKEFKSQIQYLNTLVLDCGEFEEFIESVKSPYLMILYRSLFCNTHTTSKNFLRNMDELRKQYSILTKEGFEKFNVSQNFNPNNQADWEKYRRTVNYINKYVSKIISFLKSTRSEMHISEIYDGIMHELLSHNIALLSITLPSQKNPSIRSQIPYNLPMQLCELFVDNQTVFDHICQNRLNAQMISKQVEITPEKFDKLKKWIYECCMLGEMVNRYRKQDANRIVELMEDFTKKYAEMLSSDELKKFETALCERMKILKERNTSYGRDNDVLI